MKQTKKILSLMLSALLLGSFAGCGQTEQPPHTAHVDANNDGYCDECNEPMTPPAHTEHVDENNDGKCDVCGADMGGEPVPPDTDPSDTGDITYQPRKKQEMPTAEIVDKDYDYGDESGWAGSDYSSVSLGKVYLQDVIDDDVYDWGHTVLKEDGKYKMWWVRPANYDAIFYAESTDLKNWTNLQRVISLSPNSVNITKYDNIKGMLGKPTVVHVGDTYFMYFEAPASEDPDLTQTVLEWDNQVMLATSKDGVSWQFYSDENGQPKPVIAMDPSLMHNFNMKNYGVGQPSAFYKDETFYLTYCYVMYTGGSYENGVYVATSKDGYIFTQQAENKRISAGNGMGITYNTKTGKYMQAWTNRVCENDELDFSGSVREYSYDTYDTNSEQRSFPEFVRNPHGLVDTETFYIIQMQGSKSLTDDWRSEHTTWDGYICAMNPCEYQNRMITLPNGGAATENNLAEYHDRANSYTRPSADALYAADEDIKIDGELDEGYGEAIEIARPVYSYGSNFTDTWAEAFVAWNETYLYVYARVYDDNVDTSYPILNAKQSYMHDSLDVFVDVPNDHGSNVGQAYGLEQYIISTCADNKDFIIKGSAEAEITDEFDNVRHRVRKTDFGYAVEFRVPWYEFVADMIEENLCIGLDFQINDAMGGKVGREALVVWGDHSGNAFRYTENFGDVYLIKK